MRKLGVIYQERLKIWVKLLLGANMKSYMPRRLAQRMTSSDLEWPFHASRAISAVAQLLGFCMRRLIRTAKDRDLEQSVHDLNQQST